MLNSLIAAFERLPGGLAPTMPTLVPDVQRLLLTGTSYTIPMLGATAGLVAEQFDAFPDPLQLTFQGRIVAIGRPADALALSTLRLTMDFSRADNPALDGEVVVTQPVQSDGQFQVNVTLSFRASLRRPFRLQGVASIQNAHLPVASRRIVVENATLDWFLELVDDWEVLAPGRSRQAFLARLRKTMLPSKDFNFVLDRFAALAELHPKGSAAAARLKAAYHLRFGGESISISHVLIGIEGGRQQLPHPRFPFRRTDTLVTWAGDLGGALTRYLVETYYRNNPDALTFEAYTRTTSSRADLIGDIDGVKLSFDYDANASIGDNLRSYYLGTSPRRFSRFIDATETDDGSRALSLEPGAGPPRLTAASKQFIAQQIFVSALLPFLRRTAFSPDTPPEKQWWMPPVVEAALNVNSPEVQKLAGIFVSFLEQGVAAEPR